jgi:membrane fusion protein (multidrug efflux system)
MKHIIYFFKYFKTNGLLLLALIVLSCGTKKTVGKQDKYPIISAITADSTYVQEYVAEIQSIQNVEIRTKIRGYIEKVHIDEGQQVSEGLLLFTIASAEYSQEVLKANAQLSATKAELKQAEAQVKSAEADLAQANIVLQNSMLLADKNVVSKSEAELAKGQIRVAEAKKEESLAFMETALSKVKEAESVLALAELNLSFCQIKAPFSGVINRIPNKVGSLVEEGASLTTLSDKNEMFAYFNVSETDYLNYATRKSENKVVQLKLANGQILAQSGKIESIDSEIDRSTGNLTFRARFSNSENLLKHGSSGKILVSNILSKAVLVPQKSTFEVQENLYIYVFDESSSTVKQRRIVPKMRLADLYVIEDGLNGTEKILYEGVQMVKDGDKIIPEFQNINNLNKAK